MNVKIISAILVLTLASLACGFSMDLPARQTAGPEVKESITVANPESDETRLSLTFGAGKLTLSPGSSRENLVNGTAVYNVQELKPEILKNGNSVEIKQGDFKSLPAFDNMKNEWDLKVSETPLDLTLQAGAYEGMAARLRARKDTITRLCGPGGFPLAHSARRPMPAGSIVPRRSQFPQDRARPFATPWGQSLFGNPASGPLADGFAVD